MNQEKNKKGIESLKAAVIRDTERGENCFNPNGCDKQSEKMVSETNPKLVDKGITSKCVGTVKCSHRYCDKYKWIIERANHYAEIIGVTAEDVLEAWETKRSYWYMNFYQDSNQPRIDDDLRNVRVFETVDDFHKSVNTQEFRCPRCQKTSTNPVECSQPDCDWKAYGLLKTLGSGVTVITKKPIQSFHIFMPVAWEKTI